MTDVQTFYGRWARVYDVLATLPGVQSWRQEAATALDLASGDSVVEMGCGTGANLPHLREAVGERGAVIGLDVTRGMLVRARGRGQAQLLQADATRPPLAEPVDGLLGSFVVAMFADPRSVVDQWCDLVAPDGRVALLHFTRSERTWARPINAAYRALVWGSSTNKRQTGVTESHDRRVAAAYDRLTDRTTDHREQRLAGGYLRLASGRIEA
ncbi:methyltransferase type 11 [Halobacteriales archaeon QS_4_62_28]|nr:MAG: methyltransferase type 11 [Halobacteriales archaeon QS_4_62_28]